MTDRTPRVSIGMPVRNGERFIGQAIDSLLAQSCSDFELIICDNASTDATSRICREYASRDLRIRYSRNATNLGPSINFNKCFDLSRGEYFRWHAHDDLVAPEHLAACVQALDANPAAVVAYSKTLIVDQHGKPLEEYDFHPATNSSNPAERFAALVLVNHRAHRACEIFGLMRSSALRQTPLHGIYARGDSVLLARMALLGAFIELPGRLFLSRSHASQSMQTLPSATKSGRCALTRLLGTGPLPPPEWWDPSRKGKINFPEWNLFKEYWRSIGYATLSSQDSARCRRIMARWLLQNVPKLARDVIFATEDVVKLIMRRLNGAAPAPAAAQVSRGPTARERS